MDSNSKFELMTNYQTSDLSIENNINELLEKSLSNKIHTILTGPPGTGKTRAILKFLDTKKAEIGNYKLIQFHNQYSYQDFIEGHSIKDGNFDYKKGCFLKFIEECQDNKNNIFVIDEINRGDISSIFGELMFLLDNDENGRVVQLPLSGREISVPKNLVIFATMNTADKNIALLDYALRRRFRFIFVGPNYELLKEWIEKVGTEFDIELYINTAKIINNRILKHPLMGKNMLLGQSIFVPKKDSKLSLFDVADQFTYSIIPQIESYLGIGNLEDLNIIFNPFIKNKVESGDKILPKDIENLMRDLNNSKELL